MANDPDQPRFPVGVQVLLLLLWGVVCFFMLLSAMVWDVSSSGWFLSASI